MAKRLKIHKMDDWDRYRIELYRQIISRAQSIDAGLDSRKIAYRVQANKGGIYETLKEYENGVSYNDGSWMIYTTSRRDSKGNYKYKVFCKDKEQVIKDIYSYIMFLRKIGIEAAYELNYYAVAFMVRYLQFYDDVFRCNPENKTVIGKLCQTANQKNSDEIACDSRKDKRTFALDHNEIKKMDIKHKVSMQKKIQKEMTDNRISKLYDCALSVRKNISVFKAHGLDISVGRLQMWINEKKER